MNKVFFFSLIINTFSIIVLTGLYFLKSKGYFFIPLLLSFFNFYSIFFRDLIKTNTLYIVKLFIVFLYSYMFAGSIVFNINDFLEALENFLKIDVTDFNLKNLFVYNFIVLSSLFPANYILSKKFYRKNYEVGVCRRVYQYLGNFTAVILLGYIFFLCYLLYKTGGTYIWFSNLQNNVELFSLMGWVSVFLSGLIPYAYKGIKVNKTIFFFILILIVIILFAFLKIRMYSALFLFMLLMNLNLRDFNFNKAHFLCLLIFFSVLLVLNIFRFSSFSFENTYIVVFSTLGEFIVPNISLFYITIDPLHFESVFAIKDLFLQVLPSSMRPEAELYSFRNYYMNKGVDPWPIGGIYFLGQLYFYFGYFYFFVLLLLIKYLIEVQKFLLTKGFSCLLLTFPMLVMILPRMELWTLRSSLLSVIFFLLVFMSIKIISMKKVENCK